MDRRMHRKPSHWSLIDFVLMQHAGKLPPCLPKDALLEQKWLSPCRCSFE